jgi:hypothetical protein
MYKQTPNSGRFADFNQQLGSLVLGVAFIGLILAWGVEIAVKTLFSLS